MKSPAYVPTMPVRDGRFAVIAIGATDRVFAPYGDRQSAEAAARRLRELGLPARVEEAFR